MDGNLKFKMSDSRTRNPEIDSRPADLKIRQSEITSPYSLWSRSLESPAESQFDADDSVRVANAEERDIFSEGIFKLDDLVL